MSDFTLYTLTLSLSLSLSLSISLCEIVKCYEFPLDLYAERKLIADYAANHKAVNRKHVEYIPQVMTAEQYIDASSPYRLAANAAVAAARSNNLIAAPSFMRHAPRLGDSPSNRPYHSSDMFSRSMGYSGTKLPSAMSVLSDKSLRRSDVIEEKNVDFSHADAHLVTSITRPPGYVHDHHQRKEKIIEAVREDVKVIPTTNRIPAQRPTTLPRETETSLARMRYIREKKQRDSERETNWRQDFNDADSTSEVDARVTYVRLVGGRTVKEVVDSGGASLSYGTKSPEDQESATRAAGRLAQETGNTVIDELRSTADDVTAERSTVNLPDEVDGKYTLRRFIGYQRAMNRRASATDDVATAAANTSDSKDAEVTRSDSDTRLSETVEWVMEKAGLSQLRSTGSSRHDAVAVESDENEDSKFASRPSSANHSTKYNQTLSAVDAAVDRTMESGRKLRGTLASSDGKAVVHFKTDEINQATFTYERSATDSDQNYGTTNDASTSEIDETYDDERTDPESVLTNDSDLAPTRSTSDESHPQEMTQQVKFVAGDEDDTASGYAGEDRTTPVGTNPRDYFDERDEFSEPLSKGNSEGSRDGTKDDGQVSRDGESFNDDDVDNLTPEQLAVRPGDDEQVDSAMTAVA